MEQNLKDFLAQAEIVQEQLAADHKVLSERREQNTQSLIDWYYGELQKIKETLSMVPEEVSMETICTAGCPRIKEVHAGTWYLKIKVTSDKCVEVYFEYSYNNKNYGCYVSAEFDKPRECGGSHFGSIEEVPYDILKECYEKYPDLNNLAEQKIVKAIEYATRKQCDANRALTN